MNIGLILDNPKRDLYGLLLISYFLLEKGHSVFIIPMYQQGYEVPLLDLDVILMNYLRPNNIGLIKGYHDMGISVAIMDTEGGVLSESGSDSPDKWALTMRHLEADKYIKSYMFWGDRVRKAFSEGSGIAGEKLVTTGCPRFDAFHKKWRNVFKIGNTTTVLVNTNFSAINPHFTASSDDELKAFLSAGWEADYISHVIEEFKDLLPRFTDEIRRVAGNNPDISFVLRPHPFENPSYYHDRLGDLENMRVSCEENIVDAINGAKCVLHLNCGSAVEAILGGCLPVSLEYLNSEIMRSHTPLPGKISYPARSYDELQYIIKNIDKVANDFLSKDHFDKHLAEWFYRKDGNAAWRVAEVISSFEPRRKMITGKISRSVKGSLDQPRYFQVIQGLVNNIIGHKRVSDLRILANPARRRKYIDINEIRSVIEQIPDTSSYLIDYVCHPFTGSRMTSISITTAKK